MKNRIRNLILSSLALLAAGPRAMADTPSAAPAIPDLPWEKRSDWIDVKTDVAPAAKGDGIADDTAALQAAFKMVDWKSKLKTVYLPAGTYRISHTLDLGGKQDKEGIVGGTIIGHGRSTKIVWDGEKDGSMIKEVGYTHSSFIGLTLDGRRKAATGVLHASFLFGTDMLYRHMAFLNFTGEGISIGKKHEGNLETAELLYENCLFEHCGIGVAFCSFNDYDNTFDGCEFRDCGKGIYNSHGNFYARNCHFERSADCDICSRGEHGSSVRRCTSVGSRRFIDGCDLSAMTLQDCHVEGWTDTNTSPAQDWGACGIARSSLVLDCSFSNPKGKPVVFIPNCRHVFVANIKLSAGVTLLNPVHKKSMVVSALPAGTQGGSLASAKTSFLKTSVPMPGRIFDAKRDFGARGDGKADDTEAIQKAVDAARNCGNNALAYLPAGLYRITKTLEITGSNYRFGGSGEYSALQWGGAEGGTEVHVADPDHVTLENINIGGGLGDGGMGSKNGNDILQTSSGSKPSLMCYDRIVVFNPNNPKTWKVDHSLRRGLRLEGLKKDDTVLVKYMKGNFHCVDSAAATVLCNVSFNTGHIVVEGKSKERGGFLGFLTKLGVGENPTLTVKDNHSIVIGDLYMEQVVTFLHLEGCKADMAGRVTMQGAKFDRDSDNGTPDVLIDGYRGELSIGPDQFYVSTPVKRFVSKGPAPLSILLLCNFFYNCVPDFDLASGAIVHKIGNLGTQMNKPEVAKALADSDLTAASPQIINTLDDLRRLGEIDLKLNHPSVVK